MKNDSQYVLSWSFLHATQVHCGAENKAVKRKYNALCSLIGCLGWIPAFLFGTVWEIKTAPIRILASIACYLCILYLVLYFFHIFLCVQNRRGRLEKYIEAAFENE